MFPIAGQTAGPNGLTFFEGTQGYPGGNKAKNSKFFHFFLQIFIFFNSTGNPGHLSWYVYKGRSRSKFIIFYISLLNQTRNEPTTNILKL